MTLISLLRLSNPAPGGHAVDRKAGHAVDRKAGHCEPHKRQHARRHGGLLGKSSLELLVAMAMLGMSILLAVPNLMPLLRGSGDRHNIDALAFFVDDMRVKSRNENTTISFYDGVKNVQAFEENWGILHTRYPKLLREVVRRDVKVAVPFSFHDGVLESENGYGRLVLMGKVSRRLVDVTASGELCVGRAQKSDDLKSRLPCAPVLQRSARGCDQSGGGSFYALWFSLAAFFFRVSRRQRSRLKLDAEGCAKRETRSRRNAKANLKKARGYVLVEAVVAALLLTLCVGLVYSYAARSRRENGLSRRATSKVNQDSTAFLLLEKTLHHLPKELKEGVEPIKGQPGMLRTIKVLSRREGLVLLQIAVVSSSVDAREASVHLWLEAGRLAESKNASGVLLPNDDAEKKKSALKKSKRTRLQEGGAP